MIKDIIKGMIMGIANVVPGLSGGTIAVAMGMYDKIIYAVNNLLKDPKGSIKLVWKYVIGIIIGILLAVVAVTKLFEICRLPTTCLFIGLVLGSIPMIADKLKDKKISALDIILFVVAMATLIIMPLLSAGSTKGFALDFVNILILFVIGVISAGTMIIPGVSGSMMLMIMGYYESVMNLIKDTIKALVTFNFSSFFTNAALLIPFAIGVLVGIVVIAKFIEMLLEKYNKTVFWLILGLILASPFSMVLELGAVKFTPVNIIVSLITLVIGIVVTMNLGDKDEEEK